MPHSAPLYRRADFTPGPCYLPPDDEGLSAEPPTRERIEASIAALRAESRARYNRPYARFADAANGWSDRLQWVGLGALAGFLLGAWTLGGL